MAMKCPVHNCFVQEIAHSPSGNGFVCWCPEGGCLISGNRNSPTSDIRHPKLMTYPEEKDGWGQVDPEIL